MSAALAAAEVERFRGVIAARLGLAFDDSKLAYLAEVLQRRTDANTTLAGRYLDRLEDQGRGDEEFRALASELTVPETYFFRNIDQFRALIDVVLPDCMAARASTGRIALLSAGCASGEEAYSLAILARQHLANCGRDVVIRAVDINPAMLGKARQARYSRWSLRETPADVERQWFHTEGQEFVLDRAIQTAVKFEERNLTQDDPDLWAPGAYDVVFCRNVMMYFAPATARDLVTRLTRSLKPGGYVFLGHAETLRGLSHDYHLRHTHGTFYYQRKDVVEVSRVAAPSQRGMPVSVGETMDIGWTATWIETVRRASERIQALAETPQAASVPRAGSAAVAVRSRPELGFALELLAQERFAEALELLQRVPAEFTNDPDALLMRGVLLTHGGQLAAAERVCRELLAQDDLNAGAHYLLALCREGVGDRLGAIDHDQVASYLDPAFAMPHLHLGLLSRRAEDRETARRELGQALALLGREDASRLLLFGGGFSRDALVALCRAELSASGGRP